MQNLINQQSVLENTWQIVIDQESELPQGNILVEANYWLDNQAELSARSDISIYLNGDADLEALFREGNLQQLFAYAIIHEALPNIHFKLSSSGVQVTQASFANPAGAQDMRYLADRYKENIRFLTEEVQSYLCKNKTSYIPFGFDADEFCDDCDVETKSKPSTLPIWY